MNTWEKAQQWEGEWHDNCVNSLNEELKQLTYADKMGITFTRNPKTPYDINLENKTVLDIGGGAYSLLLKASNFDRAVVIDPLNHPQWVRDRYESAGIVFKQLKGEELEVLDNDLFHEVWIYNVLQHTEDPEKIVKQAKRLGVLIRIFEWIDTPTNIGHIHTLTEENLNKWLGGFGAVENVNRNGAVGKAYFGIFKGNSY